MFPIFEDIVPKDFVFNVSNSSLVQEYPEYNLPELEVPNLSDPSTTSVVSVNEIYDLFNASRLAGFDNDVIQSIRNNIKASSQFSDVISKLSDDEIIESIKPRNIQSPSQLVQWSKYIQSIIEDRITESQSTNKTPAGSAAASEPVEPVVE